MTDPVPVTQEAPMPADPVVAQDLAERIRAAVTYQYMPMVVRTLLSEAAAALAHRNPAPAGDVLARHVAEVMEEDGGCWDACSGCQESDEGYVSEKLYPYSPIFKCQPGGGCRECGGIGVIWQDGAFLASYGDALSDNTTDSSAVSGSAEVLREAITAREVGALRYLLNWSDTPRKQVGSILKAFTLDGEQRTYTKDALESLWRKLSALTEGQRS